MNPYEKLIKTMREEAKNGVDMTSFGLATMTGEKTLTYNGMEFEEDDCLFVGAFRIGTPHVPVIVSSGSPEEEVRNMFGDHSYDAFLAKPYTLDELRRVLAAACRTA